MDPFILVFFGVWSVLVFGVGAFFFVQDNLPNFRRPERKPRRTI